MDLLNSGPDADVFLVENILDRKKSVTNLILKKKNFKWKNLIKKVRFKSEPNSQLWWLL